MSDLCYHLLEVVEHLCGILMHGRNINPGGGPRKPMVVAADQLQGRLFVAKQMMVILTADHGMITCGAEATEFMQSLKAVIDILAQISFRLSAMSHLELSSVWLVEEFNKKAGVHRKFNCCHAAQGMLV
jgi:hypothetical protein